VGPCRWDPAKDQTVRFPSHEREGGIMNDTTTISDNAGLPPIRVSLWDFWRLDALL